MNEHSNKLNYYKQSYGPKLKAETNVFTQRFDKTKSSNKKTMYWGKNNMTFMGRKRNLSHENNNLRRDKEKLLDRNDDLFDENKQLKNDNDDLLDENYQLKKDLKKANKKLRKKKEENKALKEEKKDLCEENEKLSKQNKDMCDLLSCFGIVFDTDGKQIKNNKLSPFIIPLIELPTSNSPSGDVKKSIAKQKQNIVPKTFFSQLQK